MGVWYMYRNNIILHALQLPIHRWTKFYSHSDVTINMKSSAKAYVENYTLVEANDSTAGNNYSPYFLGEQLHTLKAL